MKILSKNAAVMERVAESKVNKCDSCSQNWSQFGFFPIWRYYFQIRIERIISKDVSVENFNLTVD